ncbi:hypothetical protein [Mycetocola zhujimingii]|uniref:hypothetical protein n=1 Tax=Mycetocola zhujimingii TaxID=2079792 RepID=UPI0011B294AB|nr:hypothetical protein [Mycetocola zhujimingii]
MTTHTVKLAGGTAAGLVWFVVLSFAEGARADALIHGDALGAVPPVILATAVSCLFLFVIARSAWSVGTGVVCGLLLFALLGIVQNDAAASFSHPTALAFPSLFSRGASGISVWIAAAAAAGFAWLSPPVRLRRARALETNQVAASGAIRR